MFVVKILVALEEPGLAQTLILAMPKAGGGAEDDG